MLTPERDRQTDRQTETHRETQRQRQREGRLMFNRSILLPFLLLLLLFRPEVTGR